MGDESRIVRDVFIGRITDLARDDRDVVFISADMGAISLDVFRDELPDQFIYAGISEQNMIDVAAGLAASGKKVYTYAMASFISARCFEQLKYSVAMMSLPLTVIGVGVGLGYEDAGPAHYTTDDVGFMRTLQTINVVSPADAVSAEAIANLTYETCCFSYVRIERPVLPDVHDASFVEALSAGLKELVSGESVCILASGFMLHRALEVAERLREKGIEIGVVDLFRACPINTDALLAVLEGYDRVVTLEEQSLAGGFGSAVAEVLVDARSDKKLLRLGLPDRYLFENGGREHILARCGLSVEQIASNVEAFRASANLPVVPTQSIAG